MNVRDSVWITYYSDGTVSPLWLADERRYDPERDKQEFTSVEYAPARQQVGLYLTGIIADIAMREGVLDGWHEEVVLLTPDERDDLARDWEVMQDHLARFRQQLELLDDPQGLYSETKSLIESSAATAMRDLCVEKVQEIHEGRLRDLRTLTEKGEVEHKDAEYERAVLFILGNVIDSLKSLTLDQVKENNAKEIV